ncbi:Glucokinase [Methylobacterium sp. 4-46]|uniref:glucokinase n=1 Tax=unclassified Methylobacterium TaxID=2615210 RepID=UPI000152CCE7|nr:MULTISPECIES: glucokinase [Methylobacterium]ACA17701.1 Glucokinase [Methylobacterium sp. 4-46]WFT83370.1 glucokinase [Methylobacterium nodulans]
MFDFPVLIGDIGGTNARFALVPRPGAAPLPLDHVQTGAFPDPSAAIRHALAKGGAAPRSAILAIAGRVDGPAVPLTNAAWVIEGERIGRDFGLGACVLVNDYVPVAAGAAALDPLDGDGAALSAVGPALAPGRGSRLVLGPGTGFGAAALVPFGEQLAIVSTEAGHTDFGPSDAAEAALWPALERIEGRITVEALLSGPGLCRLYAAVSGGRALAPEAVTARGLSGEDPAAAETLALFAKLLGRLCGDLALTFLATGGVYIGGGIAPRLLPVLRRGAFRQAFVHKPPFVAMMERIPTCVITIADPAFTGLAALASRPERFAYDGQVWRAPAQ